MWLADLQADLRYAARNLAKNPGFTLVAVLTLALGIGANTAVYSAIDAAFFRPLPFPEPERLVRLRGVIVPFAETGTPRGPTPVPLTDVYAIRDVFSRSAAYATGAWNLGTGVEPLRVAVTFATTEFFETLGRQALLGRTFAPEETRGSGSGVTVLSHRLWRSQFGGDPAMVGRTVTLNEASYEVVGVMPEDFRFPAEAQLWVPLPVPYPATLISAFRNFLPSTVIARLGAGVTLPHAVERLQALREAQSSSEPPADPVTPLQRSLVGDRRSALALLMASAGLVLLIACANVANLLLSKASVRHRDMAMCAVLGATRGRILRQLLVESLMLAFVGAALGVVLARVGLPVLAALLPPDLTGLAPAQLDPRVLAFTLGLAALTAVVFGLWPAIGASRTNVGEALKSAGGRPSTRTSGRLKSGLVVAELALACLLVVSAGLMLSSLRALVTSDVGMRIDAVATARLTLPDGTYSSRTSRAEFVRSVLAQLQIAPGVEEAAAINTLPFAQDGGIRLSVMVEGGPEDPRQAPFAPYLMVSPGYFRTMGIPLLSGRDLTWADDETRSVAVINRTLARRLWPGEDALGKRFVLAAGPDITVVGLIDDARTDRLDTEILPQVYLPMQERPQNYLSFVARGPDVDALLGHVRTAVRAVDPSIPIYAAQPMQAVVGETVAPQRTNTLLISAFGALALCLAAVGIYGVLAYSVTQRTREIGVRMALGAHRPDVLALVLRQGLALSALGIGLGLAGAAATTRYLQAMLFEVTPLDPTTFVAVALLFAAVALLASYIPARRATKVDPLVALRYE